MKITQKKLPKSQMEIEFELTVEEFQKYIDRALLHLQEHIKVNGFRQGQAPTKIVEEKMGEENLLMEAGDLAVKDSYSKFISENNIEPISQPEVQILKVAKNNPFLFKIKITILPEIDLPDYKKIVFQIKKKEISVNQEEIEDALNYIKKSRAKFSQLDRPAEEKDFVEIEYESPQLRQSPFLETQKEASPKIYPIKSAEGGLAKREFNWVKDEFILGEGGLIPGFEKNLVGMKAGEEKEFSLVFLPASNAERSSAGWQNFQRKDLAGKDVSFRVRMITIQKVEFPEIDDEFAKNLGRFNNLDSLKNNIKEGLAIEKEMQEKQQKRNEMLGKITQKSKIEIPEVLIDLEKERLFKDFQQKINQNFKITLEEYLASIKNDEQTLKNSFLREAERKVKNFLILRNIGKKENILVNDNEIEEEVNKTIKDYSVEVAKKIDIDELKEYIKEAIYNEKVFEKLESFSEKY